MQPLWEEICGEMGSDFHGPFLPVAHRHVIFTLPDALWLLVRANPEVLIKDIFDAAKAVIIKIFEYRFPNYKVRPGFISIVHFTGRDLKYNPHIHMIVTEGGFTKWGNWKEYGYWPYRMMNECWKYEVLKRFYLHSKASLEAKSIIDGQRKMRFKDGTDGYVVKNYPDVMKERNIGSYLARYVRHPPIGESRIISYDGETVGIKYEWDNEIFETKIAVERFIDAIFSNIPCPGFKVVRHYGLYSNIFHRWAYVLLTGDNTIQVNLRNYFPSIVDLRLKCKTCGGVMKPVLIEYWRGSQRIIVIVG